MIVKSNVTLQPRTNINKTYIYLKQGGGKIYQVTVKIKQYIRNTKIKKRPALTYE